MNKHWCMRMNKYLVFDRPGGNIDVKVNHTRVQEDRSFPTSQLLNNVLKHNLHRVETTHGRAQTERKPTVGGNI